MIYVCCHKDFYKELDETKYNTISAYDIKTNLPLIKTDNTLDQRNWCEISCLYHLWQHCKDDIIRLGSLQTYT